MTEASAQGLSGRVVGAMFFTGFGTLWLLTGLGALHRLPWWAAVLVLALGGSLFAIEWTVSSQLGALTGPEVRTPERERTWRVFRWVNLAQWIAIPLVVVGLALLRRPEWIVPGIATVVGLHLFPLAKVFQSTMNLAVGLLLVGWSAVSVLLIPRAMVPGYGALGTAAILLASAATTLTRAAIVLRQHTSA